MDLLTTVSMKDSSSLITFVVCCVPEVVALGLSFDGAASVLLSSVGNQKDGSMMSSGMMSISMSSIVV